MQCGECTECCELLEVSQTKATNGLLTDKYIIDSKAGELCHYCEKNKGCKIYDERPTICRTFLCAYAQQKKMTEDLRPDKCGVIFEKADDTLFIGTVNSKRQISDIGLDQIRSFNEQNYSVILFKQNTPRPYISCAKGHDEFKVIETYLKYKKIARSQFRYTLNTIASSQ